MLALVLITFASYSQAPQSGPTAEARAQAMTTSMVQNLRLVSAQAAKVKEINLSSIEQVEFAKQKYKNDPRKLRLEIDLIGKTRLERIKEVLTPQQFDQFQRMREKKMGISRDGGQPGANPAMSDYSN